MKKILKLYSLALAFGLSYSVANAQTTESAARMAETESTTIITETEKKATPVAPKENNTVVSEIKAKPVKTVETNTENIELKNLNTTKKIVKGDRIKKHLKPEKKEQTNVSKTTKLAIILIIVGLIFTAVFWTGLWYLGSLLIVIGLVILLLEFLDMI